jgi:hypothetical protein
MVFLSSKQVRDVPYQAQTPRTYVPAGRLRATLYGALVSVASLLLAPPEGVSQNSTESGNGATVAVHVVPARTAAPSAIDDVHVGAGHEAVDGLRDAMAEEFPAASRATTPKLYDVPQARPD